MRAGLSRWLGGYLLVRLTGRAPERFFNLCRSRGIELWGLRATPEGCEGYMTVAGLRQSREPIRKAQVKLRIRRRYGLPFFLYRNRKRKLFFAGVAACFAMLYGLSFFIWDIQVEGNRMYTEDTLVRYFDGLDIRCGMPKSLVDCQDLEDSLRTDFPEITWVSARVSGTRLLVKIKENEVLSSVPELETGPCDLVAEKDGIITEMIVRSGTPQVAVGDTVAAGDVLISGVVPITDDGGTVVAEHYVRADGDVIARTSASYRQDYSGWRTVETMTGWERRGAFLTVGGWSLRLMPPEQGESQWKTATEEHQLALTENFCLPVWWGRILAKEYSSYERMCTPEEKEEAKEQALTEFSEKLTEKGVQIEENNARIVETGSGFSVEGSAVLREPIGESRELTSSKISAVEENDRTE